MKELTQQLIDYEEGKLNESETISLFQQLVDSGLAWNLQGHYGRFANELLLAGYIKA
jgi:hypothetical protein|tara:strand:+ start:66 stop:236 length:171 start_codon:yes stop_codon:yes gene_type:complete